MDLEPWIVTEENMHSVQVNLIQSEVELLTQAPPNPISWVDRLLQ